LYAINRFRTADRNTAAVRRRHSATVAGDSRWLKPVIQVWIARWSILDSSTETGLEDLLLGAPGFYDDEADSYVRGVLRHPRL